MDRIRAKGHCRPDQLMSWHGSKRLDLRMSVPDQVRLRVFGQDAAKVEVCWDGLRWAGIFLLL